MNTTLTEHTTDYYKEYYPSPRVEKAIFKYLDDLYYVSEDDVFFTIYKKDNDWFMQIEDIAQEIETLFGLSLPERIKIGPDKHIEPARNPIPNRVIKKRFEDSVIKKILDTEWWFLKDTEIDDLSKFLLSSDTENFFSYINSIKKKN